MYAVTQIQNPLPSGVAVQVRLLVPLLNPSQLVRVFLCLKKLPAISCQFLAELCGCWVLKPPSAPRGILPSTQSLTPITQI